MRVLLVLALGLPTACARKGPSDPVILALGGQEVRRSDFERYVAELESRQQMALEGPVRDAVLQAWLERRILVLEAQARGWVFPRASADEEQAAVHRLLVAEVHSRIQVSEEEVTHYYAEHRAELAMPERVTLRQILVATSNEARDVQRRLLKDPKGFGTLAQALSRGPEASGGGLMGTFSPGELPAELEAAAFSLAPGQTSGVVHTSLGHHVLRVEAREPARERSLDECRAHIRALLAESKSEKSEGDFVAGLMARAKVNHEAAKARPAHS